MPDGAVNVSGAIFVVSGDGGEWRGGRMMVEQRRSAQAQVTVPYTTRYTNSPRQLSSLLRRPNQIHEKRKIE